MFSYFTWAQTNKKHNEVILGSGIFYGSAGTTGINANNESYSLDPCQTITANLDSSTPPRNADGYIRVCPDIEFTLTGSGFFSDDDLQQGLLLQDISLRLPIFDLFFF